MRWFSNNSGRTIRCILFISVCYLLPLGAHAEPCNAENLPSGCTPIPANPKNVPESAEESKPLPRTPDQIIKAVYSLDTYKFCYANDWGRGKVNSASKCLRALDGRQLALIGAGDLVIALDPEAYDTATAYAAKTGSKRYVYFNGIELTDETRVTQEARFGGFVFERIHLQPKEKSKILWSAIIGEAGSTGAVPLRVGFGWQSGGATSTIDYTSDQEPKIAVSDTKHMIGAICGITLLIALALVVGIETDMLRDKYPPQLESSVLEARALREQLSHISIKRRADLLTRMYPDYERGPSGYDSICRSVADSALRDPRLELELSKVLIGLAESNISFSLTRIQLFTWFLFAVAAGMYLWFLLGELPPIDNSILGLLGISAGAAGVSWAVDASDATAVKQANAGLSTGLFSDMVRSADDKNQVHRLQAIIVNILLLAIGSVHVVRSINYPTLDSSWLIFLTISGATFALGKQINEKK